MTVNIEPGMLEGHAFTFKEYAEQMPGVTSGLTLLSVKKMPVVMAGR